MSKTLTVKTFENIVLNAIGKTIALVFSGLSNMILSRYLSSSDYGIAGFAGIFINFMIIFNDLGIGNAVIQRRELDQEGLYTAFSIKIFLGIIITVICFILSPLVPLFFSNDEKIVNVLRILSLNFIINIFYFLPGTLLTRDLNYKKLALASLSSSAIGSSVAITLAVNGFGYWTIVFANLMTAITIVVVANLIRPVKMKLCFEKKIATELMRFGGPLLISTIIIFTIFNADNFIIGLVSGPNALGYYLIGFTWGSYVCGLMSSLVLSVFFPTFSKIQSEKEKIKNSYLKILEYISFFGILANLTLFMISREFLVGLLGHGTEKWLPALMTLKIFCIYGIIRVLLEPVGSVIMAAGKTRAFIRATLLAAIVEVVFLYPALKFFNIEGVAVVVTIAYSVQYFVYIPYLKKEFDIQPFEILKAVTPAIISLLIMLAIYFSFESGQLSDSKLLLAEKGITSVAGYALLYGILTRWKIVKEAKIIMNSM